MVFYEFFIFMKVLISCPNGQFATRIHTYSCIHRLKEGTMINKELTSAPFNEIKASTLAERHALPKPASCNS